MFKAVADVTLAVGVHEENVVGKQVGEGCNREYGEPEEDVVGKKLPRGGYVVEVGRRSASRTDW